MTPTEIFNHLQGSWVFSRIISPGGNMTGQAVFNQLSLTAYHYEENGQLTLDNGMQNEAKRKYAFRLESDEIHVDYADGENSGKLFHTLSFIGDKVARTEHLCGNDMYESQYNFHLPAGFNVTHKVKGPKKDYVSVTRYARND